MILINRRDAEIIFRAVAQAGEGFRRVGDAVGSARLGRINFGGGIGRGATINAIAQKIRHCNTDIKRVERLWCKTALKLLIH